MIFFLWLASIIFFFTYKIWKWPDIEKMQQVPFGRAHSFKNQKSLLENAWWHSLSFFHSILNRILIWPFEPQNQQNSLYIGEKTTYSDMIFLKQRWTLTHSCNLPRKPWSDEILPQIIKPVPDQILGQITDLISTECCKRKCHGLQIMSSKAPYLMKDLGGKIITNLSV
jgi:hypothetical protein